MSSMEQTKSRRTTMIVAFVIAIAVVAYVGVKYTVPGDDAAGTVAPADRYRGEQISGDDVTLDDETMAQVMQTDVYQMIVSDASFAEAMQTDAFRQALSNEVFQQALSNDLFREVLSNDVFRQALAMMYSARP